MEVVAAYTEEEEKRIPLIVKAVGIDHIQEPIQRPNGIQYYQLFICTAGIGEVMLGHERGIIREGQGLFLIPNTTQIYRPVRPGWKVDYICFTGPVCTAILNSLGLSESMVFNYTDPGNFHDHLRNLVRISDSRSMRKSRAFSEECFSLLLDTSEQINRINIDMTADMDDTILRVMIYINQHYMEDISLDDIAAHIGRSKEHLCRIFKKNMQETVVHSITKNRLFHARELLLQHPEKSIEEIGAACGFQTTSYFDTVFRKWEGVSPSNYRLFKGNAI